MDDYISRVEAINRLQEIADSFEDTRDMDASYVANYCLKHIMELRPAADMRPVVRGRWIRKDSRFCYACSECGETWAYHKAFNFCPTAGRT